MISIQTTLSNSSSYTVKGVLYLALNFDEHHKIMVIDFFEVIHVLEAYLAKLLQETSKKDLISSMRGPKGVFHLSKQDLKAI